MSDHEEQRRAMRRELRERRGALSPEEQAGASAAVGRRLAQIAAIERSLVVGGYRSIRGEVDIDAALSRLHEDGAMVTVPRVSGDRMDFLPWTSAGSAAKPTFLCQQLPRLTSRWQDPLRARKSFRSPSLHEPPKWTLEI